MKAAQLQAATLLAVEILKRTHPTGVLPSDVIASAFAQACEAIREGIQKALHEGHWL